MPNFGDFNFNDDDDLVDTDPTNDNVGPEWESSSDGIQNDKTNYHEPGAGPEIGGADVSDFSTNTNPEEPSGQQDEIPPVNIDPDITKSGNLSEKLNQLGLLNTDNPSRDALTRALFFSKYGTDPTGLDNFVGKLREAGYNTNSTVNFNHVKLMDRIKNAFTKDYGIDPTGLDAFVAKLYDLGFDNSSPVDFSYVDTMQKFIDVFGPLPDEIKKYRGQDEDEIEDVELDPTGLGDFVNRLFGVGYDVEPTPLSYLIQEFQSVYGNQYKLEFSNPSYAMQILSSYNIDEDELDVILGVSDTNSESNPTNIGDIFDRSLLSEDEGRLVIGYKSLDDIFGVGMDYNDLNLEGLEGFLDFIENTDLAPYIGDIEQGSYLNEFNDLANGDFDGVL